MKCNYERYSVLLIFILFIFIFILLFIIYLFRYKNELYINIYGVCITNNIINVVVDDKELKDIYKNNNLYLDGKRYKYKINKITKKVLKKKGIYYHEVNIKFKYNYKKYKDKDVLNISIRNGKENIINMFRLIWKGEIT